MYYDLNERAARPSINSTQLEKHERFLKDSFYKTETKWPQFKVMFSGVEKIKSSLSHDQTVLILERSYFYGGYTLFAPFFSDSHVIAVDCTNDRSDKKWGQQLDWLENSDCILWRPDYKGPISNLRDIKSETVDKIFVPNVLHHERNQVEMFEEFSRVLKRGGTCLIFDGLVRELHQLPDDYVRYTPEGLTYMFERYGMKYSMHQFGSGVFDVISYVWQQAFEYFPEPERSKRREQFFSETFEELKLLDEKFQNNLEKPDKKFPMSYIYEAAKI